MLSAHTEILLKPWVIEGLFSSVSFQWIIFQQALDVVFCFGGNTGPFFPIEVKGAFRNFLYDRRIGLTVERRVPAEENVKDYATGPYIALLVVSLLENLGGDVVGLEDY